MIASAATRPLIIAPSNVAGDLWSPHTYVPSPTRVVLSRSDGVSWFG